MQQKKYQHTKYCLRPKFSINQHMSHVEKHEPSLELILATIRELMYLLDLADLRVFCEYTPCSFANELSISKHSDNPGIQCHCFSLKLFISFLSKTTFVCCSKKHAPDFLFPLCCAYVRMFQQKIVLARYLSANLFRNPHPLRKQDLHPPRKQSRDSPRKQDLHRPPAILRPPESGPAESIPQMPH